MAKKVEGYIKLQIPAGQANPSPPVGPALGQRGVNIMEFCKAFNAATQDMEQGMPIPVKITVYADRQELHLRDQDAAGELLSEEGGEAQDKGSEEPGRETGRQVTMAQVREIAEAKMADLNANDVDAGGQDHRRLRPFDGPRSGGGLRSWRSKKRHAAAPEEVDRDALQWKRRSSAQGNHGQVRRDRRDRHEPGRRSAPRGPDGARRGQRCRTAPARTVRVAVFAKGDKAEEAKAAGADIVGAEDLAEKVQKGRSSISTAASRRRT